MLEWMGIHALPIYVLIACNLVFLIIHGFYWKKPINNLVSFTSSILPFNIVEIVLEFKMLLVFAASFNRNRKVKKRREEKRREVNKH